MPRNFFRRIELVFPIEDGNLRERLVREVLATSLADNVKARLLEKDGSYHLAAPPNGTAQRRSQFEFIDLAQAEPGSRKRGLGRPAAWPKVKLAPPPWRRPRTQT